MLLSSRLIWTISRDFIDWDILQRRDFRYDGEVPEKTERYQAEALVHRRLPMSALSGVVGATQGTVDEIAKLADKVGVELKILLKPGLYF